MAADERRRHPGTGEVRARARSVFWYLLNALWITLLLALGLPVLVGALTHSDRTGRTVPARAVAPASSSVVAR